jgi:SAM-dependent methyltransferase
MRIRPPPVRPAAGEAALAPQVGPLGGRSPSIRRALCKLALTARRILEADLAHMAPDTRRRDRACALLCRLVALECAAARGMGVVDPPVAIEGPLLAERIEGAFAAAGRDFGGLFDEDPRAEGAATGERAWPSEGAWREVLAAVRALDRSAYEADETLGFLYQDFHREDKARAVGSTRKIEGDALLRATQLYTERYMVDFLVQNTLGRLYYELRGGRTELARGWPYFVAPAPSTIPERAPRPVSSITVLDPACGTGHFFFAAFELLAGMYAEEGIVPAAEIPARIVEKNLFGIDIDARAVQLARFGLDRKAREELVAGGRTAPRPVAGCNVVSAPPSLAEFGALLRPDQDPDQPAPDGARDLFDLVGRRYDVVLCNPPYVGFRKLATRMVAWLAAEYPRAKMDLFVAFIDRCAELLAPDGLMGLVTPSSWLTSSKTEALRAALFEQDPGLTVSLGQQTFEDAPLLYVSLFVAARRHERAALQVIRCERPPSGPALLRSLPAAVPWDRALLERLPSRPLLPTAPAALIRALDEGTPVGRLFATRDGVWTGMRERDVRFFWEIDAADARYCALSGGKGYRRWYGAERLRVQRRVAEQHGASLRGASTWEYARVAGGKLSARRVSSGSIAMAGVVSLAPRQGSVSLEPPSGSAIPIADAGPPRIVDAAASLHDESLLGAVMNSRIGTAFLRTLVSGLNFNPGYCKQIPLPAVITPAVAERTRRLVDLCVELARDRDRADPTTDAFVIPRPAPGTHALSAWADAEETLALALDLASLLVEGRLEAEMLAAYGVDAAGVRAMAEELGPMVTDYPLLAGDDDVPAAVARRLPPEVIEDLALRPRVTLSSAERADLEARLAARCHARLERGAKRGRSDFAAHPLPPATFLEELCRHLALHPVSVARLLLRLRAGDPSPAHRRAWVEKYLGVLVCRLAGYRWPSEITAARDGERVDVTHLPESVVVDGILTFAALTLSDGVDVPSLARRVRTQLALDFEQRDGGEMIAADFARITGMAVEEWLERRFFELHLKSFKGRPILWHLSSGSAGSAASRRKPAFAALVLGPALTASRLQRLREVHVAAALAADVGARGALEIKQFAARLAEIERGGSGLHIHVPWDPRRQSPRPFDPDVADGVRVNMVPFHRAGLMPSASAGGWGRALVSQALDMPLAGG